MTEIGLTGKVLSGTPRDPLNVVDLVYNPDGGPRPDVLITDAGSYSDVVFGIVTMLGFDYRPVLADLSDTKLGRVDARADYGMLDKAARGRVDLDKIRRHWPDVLRVIASVHTREISAHDVIRVLQHDGRLTDLGEAVAHYGRIFKTRHVLAFADDPDYRRHLKGMRNLQEGRHGLWDALREQAYPVLDADAARLSAYQYRHINVHGHYTFALPELDGARRPLRDPDAVEE
ncbi:transposase [Actinoplanes utahensis]|uniref:transposase n=1 Tax=Actinoplanes utahensis TaxID=1869 RepID=UPI001A3E985B|nr:transposase [Actinoplanes utahensis]GIF33791.1 hypothetical protein Aut01nite_67770 [Actinoplanes utahensis]